jgi:hypothetical protein
MMLTSPSTGPSLKIITRDITAQHAFDLTSNIIASDGTLSRLSQHITLHFFATDGFIASVSLLALTPCCTKLCQV